MGELNRERKWGKIKVKENKQCFRFRTLLLLLILRERGDLAKDGGSSGLNSTRKQ
jgi:hypothetical protein